MILKYVANMIKNYMGLRTDQIWLANEKYIVPNDTNCYVTVGFTKDKVIGNTRNNSETTSVTTVGTTIVSTTTFYETVVTNKHAIVAIDFYGKTFDIFQRKDEILQSFKSAVNIEYQATKGFYIAPHPINMVNIPNREGSAILNRYKVEVAVMYSTSKTVNLSDTTTSNTTYDYYDIFTKEVTDD